MYCCVCFETFSTFQLNCSQCKEGKVCHACVLKMCSHKSQHVLSCPICQKKTTISEIGVALNWDRLQVAFLMCTTRLVYLFVCLVFTSFVGWLVIGYTCAFFISVLNCNTLGM